MSNNTGGSAFPDGSTNSWGNAENPGMTMRDYFAAKALQGLLSCSYPVSELGYKMKDGKSEIENSAIFCYEMADALLAERLK